MDRTHKAPKLAPEDFISTMPNIVVTNILDRLPIHDAVRTSILARNWRLKWTMLSQLVFDDNFLSKINNYRVRIIITRLLHNIRGTITKFSFSSHNVLDVEDEDISHWILFLSSKGIKDLTLAHLTLPTHIFSCLELEHLRIYDCCFGSPPTFHGFPKLLSLHLDDVEGVETPELGEFITRCPLLEILKLFHFVKVELVKVAKLKNLKVLDLSLCDLITTTIISSNTIFELLGSLPKLQKLHLRFRHYKLTQGGAKTKFPTAFLSLKALRISKIDLGNGMNFSCAFELIKSCPNLQILEIKASQHDCDPIPIPEGEYNITGLQSVLFTRFEGSENEMCLIKCLLACSPVLKRFFIRPRNRLTPAEQLMLTTKLLKLPRASTVAEIVFKYLLD